MRTRLFLSAAVATLSLSLSQGYAQNIGQDRAGGEAAKQGESMRPQKPAAQGAAEEPRQQQGASEERRQQQGASEEHRQQQQGAAEERRQRQGAAEERRQQREERAAEKKSERDAREAAKKPGRDADKNEEKRGAARKDDRKDDMRGAMGEDRDRSPAARSDSREGATGRAGKTPGERTGAAAPDNERRATEADRGRAGRFAQPERRGEDQVGQGDRRGASDRATGRDATRGADVSPRGGVSGRDATAGRNVQDAGRVQLSQRQHSQVRQIISQTNVQRLSRNAFNVRIGAVVPPNVQFYPLPPDVIALVPQFQGYDYAMVDDDIVIIDPGSREVVSLLDEGGPPAAYGYNEEREEFRGGGYERREGRGPGAAGRDGRERRGDAYGYAPRARLDARQERALYRGLMNEANTNLKQVCVRVGERVPESVDIQPVPRTVAAEAPDAERYEYFVLNDQIVLVNPDTRIVVDIIQEPR